jgi:hypothetical protein
VHEQYRHCFVLHLGLRAAALASLVACDRNEITAYFFLSPNQL